MYIQGNFESVGIPDEVYAAGAAALNEYINKEAMKRQKPKARMPIYTVVRLAPKGSGIEPHVKDSYSTLQKAEEMCGVFQQELLEKEVFGFTFKTFINYYYD